MFKTAGLALEVACATATGGLAVGASAGELLHVPVRNEFGEAQIRANQNLVDPRLMQCQWTSCQWQWGQKDGHWLEGWLTHQMLEATRLVW